MVEVFKTNVEDLPGAAQITAMLSRHFPGCRINFDLEDCDRILRMEGWNFTPEKVAQLVQQNGFHCSVLEG